MRSSYFKPLLLSYTRYNISSHFLFQRPERKSERPQSRRVTAIIATNLVGTVNEVTNADLVVVI